jgi:hypothetical protein
MRRALLCLLICLSPLASCVGHIGNAGNVDDAGHDATVPPADTANVTPPVPTLLTITPTDATLDVEAGGRATLVYTVTAQYADGHTDTTVPALVAIDTVGVGAFDGRTFVATGTAGAIATVTASYLGARATTHLTVRLHTVRGGDGVAADLTARAVDALPRAAEDPTLAPVIAYPSDGTMMPPNLYRVEWQWRPVTGADLYLTTFTSPTTVFHVVSVGNTFVQTPEDWRTLIESNRGQTVTMTVRAARAADLTRAGSASVRVTFGPQDLTGGLYYFTTNEDQSQQGIYRYDFGVPVPASTRFLANNGPGTCVGCHVLSRDGEHMAVSFEGGYGYLATLNVRDPGAYTAGGPSGPERGAFAAFFDDDRSVLAVFDGQASPLGGDGDATDPRNGQILAYDATTGAVDAARQVPIGAGHRAAHVTVAPDGRTAVYVDYADSAERPFHEARGSIMAIGYDPERRAWGAPRVVVPYDGVSNNYYPSVSPDGRWVLFNRAPGDAYDNPEASIWVVPLDGSRAPIELANAGAVAHATNSWPRWAPFMRADELGATRLWFTFSSKRDYGVRLVGAARAQIWMAAFDPNVALSGADGSAAAFWLPFQNLETRNHTAVWTERVAPRNCQRHSDCLDPALVCNPTSRTCQMAKTPG